MSDEHQEPAPAGSAPLLDLLMQAHASGMPVDWPDRAAESLTLRQAQDLQEACVQGLLMRHGGSVLGLKIGGTTAAALQALQLDTPFTGPILSAWRQHSPAQWPRTQFRVCAVEAEIGLRLGRDLGGSAQMPSRETMLEAIDQVFPAIEVADSRLANWATAPACAIVADLGFAGAWVQGDPCERWREHDLRTLAVSLSYNGSQVRTGSGAMVLGDPLQALGLVVADLGRRGQRLRAGTLVTTGTCTLPWPAPGPGLIVADFGPLGQATLTLS
jgi:2-keto-4-pentenoate hydratase